MPDEQPAPGPEPSPSVAATAAPPEPKEDWETRFKYLFADFENYRRRTAKEREATDQQVRGALLRELLPLVEAFQAGAEAAAHHSPSDPLRRGFELLDREWSKFLCQEGVEPVAEVGQPFHAGEAEAVGEGPPTETAPEGTVREVVQQGYRYAGGLLRPAKVIVARVKGAEAPSPPESAEGAEPTEADR